LKLYDSRRAPNPRRVRWFMAEKGIDDVEIVDVDDLRAASTRRPDYLAKAGLPHVPALEIDATTTITESVAICRYLESVSIPSRTCSAAIPLEVAVIEMWTRRVEMLVSTPHDDGRAPQPPGAWRRSRPRSRRSRETNRQSRRAEILPLWGRWPRGPEGVLSGLCR
jgi:glutathione S-transferase